MAIKQANRLLAIKTALGANALAVRSVSIEEQMSRLFAIEAELSSEDGNIDLDKVVGHDATIRLDIAEKDKRFFNGYVSKVVQLTNRGGFAQYRATIVPWLWLLSRTTDCCIFQEMSVPEIIEDIFKHYGFNDYKLKLSASYEKWEYCVQYRETDFNFISRLMEEEGNYYFFENQDEKQTLVMVYLIRAHAPLTGYKHVIVNCTEKIAS